MRSTVKGPTVSGLMSAESSGGIAPISRLRRDKARRSPEAMGSSVTIRPAGRGGSSGTTSAPKSVATNEAGIIVSTIDVLMRANRQPHKMTRKAGPRPVPAPATSVHNP